MPSPTFRTVAYRWLSESAGSVAPATIEHYRWLLERHVWPGVGEMAPGEITEDVVRELVEQKLKEGMSANTAYVLPKLIARVLSFASSEGLCEAPRWEFGKGRPEKESPTVILTEAQERQLLAHLMEHPSPKHLALYIILTTGVGIREVLGLTWADVSLPRGRIRVSTQTGSAADTPNTQNTPNTRNSYRAIDINERHKIYLRRMASEPGFYLASGKGRPATAMALRDGLIRACREVSMPEMTLTDLRRTFAVHALEGGWTYAQVAAALGQKNGRNFRASYRELVSPETKERLEEELLASRKPRQTPEHINCIGPDLSPEVVALRQKVEAKKKQLNETFAALEGDLEIVHTLRRSNLAGLGRPREGLYQFIEKVLGDDRDGKMLVEYLRCNMRVADMPSHKDVCVQTIRSRVARGFDKLIKRLDAIYEVEGYDILDMFHSLTAKIQEVAPPAPKKSGRKPKLSLENEYKKAMEDLERMKQ